MRYKIKPLPQKRMVISTMPISFTDRFNLDKNKFNAMGAFDTILDVDSRFFIDPVLLDACNIAEFIGARAKTEKYFAKIILLLTYAQNTRDMYWKKADKMLSFTEITGTCLGYSQNNTSGNAIGKGLRDTILHTIKELITVGEKDPTLFELLGVFQEGIGCDRVSDLLTFILAPEIMKYTQRVVTTFSLANHKLLYRGKEYFTYLNEYNGKPLFLLPASILSPLLIAEGFNDIDRICQANERVRHELNEYFDFESRRTKLQKSEILQLMKSSSSFRNALITAYTSSPVVPYDFESDPIGENAWYAAAKEYAEKCPLQLCIPSNPTISDVYTIVETICSQFKNLIEDNGLWRLLYNDDSKPKHERAAQLLFFGIADSYCTANDIDLSREINNGRGAVDFKLSHGAKDKVVIEIKLTSNSQLIHGFATQLPIYMIQEKTNRAIYLIIDVGHPKRLATFIDFYNRQTKDCKDKITSIIVYATPPKSASVE